MKEINSLTTLLFIFGITLNANNTPANNSQIRNGVKKNTATGLSSIKQSDKKIDVKKAASNMKTIKNFLNLNLYKKNNINGNTTQNCSSTDKDQV